MPRYWHFIPRSPYNSLLPFFPGPYTTIKSSRSQDISQVWEHWYKCRHTDVNSGTPEASSKSVGPSKYCPGCFLITDFFAYFWILTQLFVPITLKTFHTWQNTTAMIAKRLDESKSKLQNVLNIARLHHTQAMKFYLALHIIFHRKRKNDPKTTGSQTAKYNLMASMCICD